MTQGRLVGLHWFQHDLRVADNQALFDNASNVSKLICVFVVDPRWFKSGHFQSAHMGKKRWAFLYQSLQDLQHQLHARGQQLWVRWGDPVEQVHKLVSQHQVSHLSFNHHSGVYERQQIKRLANLVDFVQIYDGQGHSLFYQTQLPFPLPELPTSFTPFRKRVESISIDRPIQAASTLPPCVESSEAIWDANIKIPEGLSDTEFVGGSAAGLKQLNYYLFESDLVAQYKQTRNGLDGWDYSSKLSPWLANGCISARQVYRLVKDYEAQRQQNESTYWLYFELLWREYFYWYARLYSNQMFRVQGVKNKKPLTTFWPQRFARWCNGSTPYPIINACMRQLNQTGFMSNRGRQLVASALVHELNIDWRYGAAYFEQQLLDFDVASNYGNWQYLAGVGADPRGHRHFDLEKQTRIYDPDGEFIRKWQGDTTALPLDESDPADWPIG